MNSLKNHVDFLFRKYKENIEIRELKQEVLSNLEAKISDLTANGTAYEDAVKRAIESINSIDYLIDNNRKVYLNKLKLEYVQIVLLYLLILWIITIPLKIIGAGILTNMVLFLCCVISGIWYFSLLRASKSESFNQIGYINIETAYRMKKFVWIIWILFIIISTLYTTGIYFASNIWFSRPVRIEGPYQFALISIKYLFPVMTVIIPLILNAGPRLILKYEAGEDDEIKA